MNNYSEKHENYYSLSRPEMLEFIREDELSSNSKVLDVGCGEGLFASSIKKIYNCEVYGIELHKEAAEKARELLDKVESEPLNLNSFQDLKFNIIFFNDVLEHMDFPEKTLELCLSKLTENGVIIASIPNLKNYTTMKNLLLKDNFEYTNSGVLDYTHLRFFTKSSIISMFQKQNYIIEEIKGAYPLINGSRFLKLLNIFTFGKVSKSNFNYISFNLRAKPKK